MVAHILPGSLVLSPRAVQGLARLLSSIPRPMDVPTRAVVSDIIRLSQVGHVSRDTYTEFLEGIGESTLTTTQAAHRLGISPGAVRKRISRGVLPAQFDGQRWHINPNTLKE